MAKVQDRYASVVNKKWREDTFQAGDNVWLDSRNLEIPTELSIKWSARWIGPFPVKKILNPDVRHWQVGEVTNASKWGKAYTPNRAKYE